MEWNTSVTRTIGDENQRGATMSFKEINDIKNRTVKKHGKNSRRVRKALSKTCGRFAKFSHKNGSSRDFYIQPLRVFNLTVMLDSDLRTGLRHACN